MASWTQKRKEKAGGTERIELVYVHYRAQNRCLVELGVEHRELSSALCGDLEEWDGGGGKREIEEGGHICTHIADPHCCATKINTAL